MEHFYRAYGLACLSDTPISGLQSEPYNRQSIHLHMHLGSDLPEWVRTARELPARSLYRRSPPLDAADSAFTASALGSGKFFELAYSDGANFIVDRFGERLWGRCAAMPQDFLETYLRGPIMGFVLRRRDVIALHASALSIDGHAVVLCGPSEAGKSMTAAALAIRGVSVLSDDIAALRNCGGRFQVASGYPRICLWPEAVRDLCGRPDILPRLTPSWEKCFLPLDGPAAKFDPQQRPLGAIYFLGPRTSDQGAPRVEKLSARLGLLELVQNTYMNWLLDKKQRAAEFDTLGQIAAQTPMRRIIPHVDATRIGNLCDLILKDAAQLFSARETAGFLHSH